MALAAAIAQIEADGSAILTNYGAFLAGQPPTFEVEIRERTSWSCPHGVERWRSDCGCRTRTDWHQRWRAPLRESLDWLRDHIDAFYESRASALLKSPWEARDAYIDVILDRSRDGLATWLARHRRVLLDAAAQVETRRLLEMERNRLLMYTSCGWFFDEVSALEPTQTLKYAAMTLQYLRDLGGEDLEGEFVRRLEAAPTNVPLFVNGGEVYRALIKPAVVDLRRVVAHYAISGLFEDYPDEAPIYAWRVKRLDDAGDNYDGSRLRVGRARVASEITGESRDLQYTVLRFGGHDFSCGIRTYEDPAAYDTMKADLLRRYGQRSMTDTVRGLDEHFPEGLFSLTHLFLEQRRRVLASVMQAVLSKHEQTYRHVWEESRKLIRYLRQADAPIPEVLRITSKYVLEEELVAEVARAADSTTLPERAFEISEEARALGLELDCTAARPSIRLMVGLSLDALAERVTAERVTPSSRLSSGPGGSASGSGSGTRRTESSRCGATTRKRMTRWGPSFMRSALPPRAKRPRKPCPPRPGFRSPRIVSSSGLGSRSTMRPSSFLTSRPWASPTAMSPRSSKRARTVRMAMTCPITTASARSLAASLPSSDSQTPSAGTAWVSSST